MGYLTANDRPGHYPPSWYLADAGETPEHSALDHDVEADVCVIGAGYAGLSAALHLAEAGVDVVLLEANRVGWGASGRNGGQLGVGPRADMAAYERLTGRETARRVWDIALEANRLVRDLVARHGIECHLKDGYLEASWKAAHERDVMAWPEVAARYGHDAVRPVDRVEMREMLGTTRYFGGFLDTLGGHLQPLRYALGLADAADAAGARIHEQTRVTRLDGTHAVTQRGTVKAQRVLLACNGYLDSLSRRAGRRMMPINNFIGATEPLGENRARKIIRDDVCVCDTKFVLNYFRLSPDHRLLWGGGESYGQRFPKDMAALVRRKMLEVYPDLADVSFTHVWGGTLAITATRFPSFHRLGPDTLSVGGWSGSGIHMATMGGKIAADALRGNAADWDLMAKLPTPAFPGGDWFRAPLLAAAMSWASLRDRL